jgi:hypothetical protein
MRQFGMDEKKVSDEKRKMLVHAVYMHLSLTFASHKLFLVRAAFQRIALAIINFH